MIRPHTAKDGLERLGCPYHGDMVEPRWDEEDPQVAWCPECDRTIAVLPGRTREMRLERKLLDGVRLLTTLRKGYDDRWVNEYVSSVRGEIGS